MGFMGTFYRTVGRRFSTILLFSTISVFVFDFTFNKVAENFWDNMNKNKQWKDIKLTLGSTEEEEEA